MSRPSSGGSSGSTSANTLMPDRPRGPGRRTQGSRSAPTRGRRRGLLPAPRGCTRGPRGSGRRRRTSARPCGACRRRRRSSGRCCARTAARRGRPPHRSRPGPRTWRMLLADVLADARAPVVDAVAHEARDAVAPAQRHAADRVRRRPHHVVLPLARAREPSQRAQTSSASGAGGRRHGRRLLPHAPEDEPLVGMLRGWSCSIDAHDQARELVRRRAARRRWA